MCLVAFVSLVFCGVGFCAFLPLLGSTRSMRFGAGFGLFVFFHGARMFLGGNRA